MLSSLSEYTEIISVSVGLNLAYVIITNYLSKQETKNNFFDIISLYVDGTINRILKSKTNNLSKLGYQQIEVQYYLSVNECTPSHKAIADNIDNNLNEISNEANELAEKGKAGISAVVNAKYFPHISLLLASYGIFILFISPLEKRFNINFNGFLFFLTLINFLCLLHTMAWELPTICKSNKKIVFISSFLAPRFRYIILSQVLFYGSFLILVFYKQKLNNNFSLNYPFLYRNSLVLTTTILFSSFIFYSFISFIRVESIYQRFKFQLQRLKIDDKVNHNDQLLRPLKDTYLSKPLDDVAKIILKQKLINGKSH